MWKNRIKHSLFIFQWRRMIDCAHLCGVRDTSYHPEDKLPPGRCNFLRVNIPTQSSQINPASVPRRRCSKRGSCSSKSHWQLRNHHQTGALSPAVDQSKDWREQVAMSARAEKASQEGVQICRSLPFTMAGKLGNELLRKDGARKGWECWNPQITHKSHFGLWSKVHVSILESPSHCWKCSRGKYISHWSKWQKLRKKWFCPLSTFLSLTLGQDP